MDFALSLGWFCIIYILTAKEALLQKFPAIRKSKYFARNPFFGKARSSSQSCRTANLRLFTHKLLSLLRRKSSNLHIDQKPESWKSKAHLQRKRNFPWVYYLEAELLQPKNTIFSACFGSLSFFLGLSLCFSPQNGLLSRTHFYLISKGKDLIVSSEWSGVQLSQYSHPEVV